MAEIRVLNKNLEFDGIIDIYESFIWTERFNEYGDFELYTQMDPYILDTVQIGDYLEIADSDYVMVVESVVLDHDYEQGNHITIKGRSVESILDRRVIWDYCIFNNVGLGSLIKTLLINAIINPADASRKIDNFIFDEPVDESIENIRLQSVQFYGENLYSVISALCQTYKIGFKITIVNKVVMEKASGITDLTNTKWYLNNTPDLSSLEDELSINFISNGSEYTYFGLYDDGIYYNTSQAETNIYGNNAYVDEAYRTIEIIGGQHSTNADLITWLQNNASLIVGDVPSFLFSLYSGKDSTYAQDVNPYVVFSPDFDNVLNTNFINSDQALKNICLVLGEGEGEDRTAVKVNTNQENISGINRREMSISESITSSGQDSFEPYEKQLYEKGKEALLSNQFLESYDAQINPRPIYIYGVDYGLGDIVQISNDFGLESVTRVSEYIRSYSTSGIDTYPTFVYDGSDQTGASYNTINVNTSFGNATKISTWEDIELPVDLSAPVGTKDYNLYTAINNVGWGDLIDHRNDAMQMYMNKYYDKGLLIQYKDVTDVLNTVIDLNSNETQFTNCADFVHDYYHTIYRIEIENTTKLLSTSSYIYQSYPYSDWSVIGQNGTWKNVFMAQLKIGDLIDVVDKETKYGHVMMVYDILEDDAVLIHATGSTTEDEYHISDIDGVTIEGAIRKTYMTMQFNTREYPTKEVDVHLIRPFTAIE